jgi:3-hydroxy-9,10-secoandrosta-1,3,5(10)-triene-9,17-dione monooxygenase reductase component
MLPDTRPGGGSAADIIAAPHDDEFPGQDHRHAKANDAAGRRVNDAAFDPRADLSADGPAARRRLRNVLGNFATGVTVVTGLDARGADVGITVNSFTSVSLEPPLVLWCVGRSSATVDAFGPESRFVVNVLARDQYALAMRFADRRPDRFRDLDVDRGIDRVPMLRGCIARLQCTTRQVADGGDHLIVIGEITRAEQAPGEPLLFFRGEFEALLPTAHRGKEID